MWTLPYQILPVHVSTPATPPAHMKLVWSLKWRPSFVVLRLSWHSRSGTKGSATFFKFTRFSPPCPNLSFPQPVAKQFRPSNLVSWGGKQIVLMCGPNFTGVSRTNSATSLNKFFAPKSGWMINRSTSCTECGKSSFVVCVSHSPAFTLKLCGVWLKQWALVRTTDGWISEPPQKYSSFFVVSAIIQGNSPNFKEPSEVEVRIIISVTDLSFVLSVGDLKADTVFVPQSTADRHELLQVSAAITTDIDCIGAQINSNIQSPFCTRFILDLLAQEEWNALVRLVRALLQKLWMKWRNFLNFKNFSYVFAALL